MQEELNVDVAAVGRVLHYVIQLDGKTVCRPGIVIQDNGKGFVDLEVFGLGDRSVKIASPNHNSKRIQTWHWPRACEGLKNE